MPKTRGRKAGPRAVVYNLPMERLNSSTRPIVGLLAACALSLFPPPLAAAAPSSRAVSEEVHVSLRLIDVLATDKLGEPLVGLGPEDFSVLIDGKERAIRTFDATVGVSAKALPSAGGARPSTGGDRPITDGPAPDRPGRWVVILLDADRMPHNYRNVVLKTARAVITAGVGTGDRYAVALLRDGNLIFLQDFALAGDVDLGVLDDPGRLISRANDLRFRLDELAQLVTSCKEMSFVDGCVMTRSEEFFAAIDQENDSGFSAINGLISAMYPLPGRKALIWFSNGFVLRPGDVVREMVSRYVGDVPTLSSRLDRRERPYIEELTGAASRAQVSFFALRAGNDFSHVMRGADTATLEQPIDRQAGNPYKLATTMSEETLRDVAEATGGKVVMTPLSADLADGLLNRLDGVYTLGIEVQPGDTPRSKLRVKLNVKQADVQVRKRIPLRGAPSPSLAAILRDAPTGLKDTVGVRLILDLDLVRAEKDRDSGVVTSRLACFARLRRPDGVVVDQSYLIFEVLRGDASVTQFDETITFDQPPGDYEAEVTVSDLIGNGSTSVVAPLTMEPRAAD